MRKKIDFIFIVSFVFIIFQIKAFALTLSPFYVVINTEYGKPSTEIVRLINEFGSDYEVTATLMDIGYDSKGNKVFRPIGGFPNSVAKNIKIRPEKIILKSNETKEVQISIEQEKDWIGGKQAMVYFEAVPATPNAMQKKSAKVKMGIRLGCIVLQQTKGTVITKSRIKSVEIIQPTKSSPLILNLEVINQGNSHIIAVGTVAITKEDNSFVGKIDLNKTILLPEKTKTISGEWSGDLEKGTYHAIITYQYDEEKNIVIDKVFKVE